MNRIPKAALLTGLALLWSGAAVGPAPANGAETVAKAQADITYIEEAMRRFDRGELEPETARVKTHEDAIALARAQALRALRDEKFLGWVEREAGLAISGGGERPDNLMEYLLAVRTAADRADPAAYGRGLPVPDGTFLSDGERRAWFAQDWFDTPLRHRER
jgi:hypothetical protein